MPLGERGEERNGESKSCLQRIQLWFPCARPSSRSACRVPACLKVAERRRLLPPVPCATLLCTLDVRGPAPASTHLACAILATPSLERGELWADLCSPPAPLSALRELGSDPSLRLFLRVPESWGVQLADPAFKGPGLQRSGRTRPSLLAGVLWVACGGRVWPGAEHGGSLQFTVVQAVR